ncbi:DUF998 domain-containing protein [Marinomonas mediterranea]|uniref:DUF998 domain-containing protein n=1 Tax=Marinomonas mediterranea TaxID=119864 RepID=UPI00234B1A8D|nr:DUF998 domain-containing protein [Marinomonas mediterranea]WCN08720.1 DUF998 domain-containing protein [Marinomonas mediterranea]
MDLSIKRKISASLICVVAISYLAMLFGGGMVKPHYSHLAKYISELNATDTPYTSLIGYLGFVPFGVLSAILIVFVFSQAPIHGVTKVGVWLLFAEPVAYVGSAIAPCDIGCPATGSTSQAVHNALGIFTYIGTWSALLLFAFAPKIRINRRILWLSCSIVWVVLFSLMMDGSFSPVRGGLQRLAEWIVYSTLLIAAWRVLSRSRECTREK